MPKKSLAETHPEVAKQWHPTKNGDLTPFEVGAGTSKKIWWKCVQCSSNENLEFDHIIPHSKGGNNTYRNIQLLCEPCNRSKSAKIG